MIRLKLVWTEKVPDLYFYIIYISHIYIYKNKMCRFSPWSTSTREGRNRGCWQDPPRALTQLNTKTLLRGLCIRRQEHNVFSLLLCTYCTVLVPSWSVFLKISLYTAVLQFYKVIQRWLTPFTPTDSTQTHFYTFSQEGRVAPSQATHPHARPSKLQTRTPRWSSACALFKGLSPPYFTLYSISIFLSHTQ